jgi:hypothetical protein
MEAEGNLREQVKNFEEKDEKLTNTDKEAQEAATEKEDKKAATAKENQLDKEEKTA